MLFLQTDTTFTKLSGLRLLMLSRRKQTSYNMYIVHHNMRDFYLSAIDLATIRWKRQFIHFVFLLRHFSIFSAVSRTAWNKCGRNENKNPLNPFRSPGIHPPSAPAHIRHEYVARACVRTQHQAGVCVQTNGVRVCLLFAIGFSHWFDTLLVVTYSSIVRSSAAFADFTKSGCDSI